VHREKRVVSEQENTFRERRFWIVRDRGGLVTQEQFCQPNIVPDTFSRIQIRTFVAEFFSTRF
jgi:hypothetical protein